MKLYVRRVFILDHAKELLPNYLRFVRGLVDSADLPLNVSRELLQGNKVVTKIRAALVKRVLDLLEEMAKNRADDYAVFWKQFGQVLKEGIVEDADNRERIAGLLRFASTHTPDAQSVSLADYIGRMKDGQDKIYYLTGESHKAAAQSPHLEGFRKRELEVLLLSDRVDEWVVGHLNEFDGKALDSAAQGDADLADPEAKAEQERLAEQCKDVLERASKVLEGRVQAVRASVRLTESPSCLISDDAGMSRHLIKMLKEAGQDLPEAQPILEINPEHPLIQRMQSTEQDSRFADLVEIVYAQAVLAEGGQLEAPADFVRRLNQLILNNQQAEAAPTA